MNGSGPGPGPDPSDMVDFSLRTHSVYNISDLLYIYKLRFTLG